MKESSANDCLKAPISERQRASISSHSIDTFDLLVVFWERFNSSQPSGVGVVQTLPPAFDQL